MSKTKKMFLSVILSLVICLSAYVQANTESTISTTDGNPITASELKEMLDEYIPDDESHSTLVILTQCYGGNMVDDLVEGRPGTKVNSATSPGETATYGGYDDDAAEGLEPGEDKTSDDSHEAGTEGKDDGETPTTSGGDATSLESVDPVDGPIKSRHIIIYAGIPNEEDESQVEEIEDNFAGEEATTVKSVGGDGTGDWDYPGTQEGLEDAMEDVQEEMNAEGIDPTAEQFILFVTDHGGLMEGDVGQADSGGNMNTGTFYFGEVLDDMRDEPDNLPTLTVLVQQLEQPANCNITIGTAVFSSVPFDEWIDQNDNDTLDPNDGDGWQASVLVDESLLNHGGDIVTLDSLPPDVNVSVTLYSGNIGKNTAEPLVKIMQIGEVDPQKIHLNEGGVSKDYGIVLTQDPNAAVTIDIVTDAQLSVSPVSLSFDSGNFDIMQTVTVSPFDDSDNEGGMYAMPEISKISHNAVSTFNTTFDGIAIKDAKAYVRDNEVYCGQKGTDYLPSDINMDCYVNLLDVAEMAQGWLFDTDPAGTGDNYPTINGIGITWIADPDKPAVIRELWDDTYAGILNPGDTIVEYMGVPISSGLELYDTITLIPDVEQGESVDIKVKDTADVETDLSIPAIPLKVKSNTYDTPGAHCATNPPEPDGFTCGCSTSGAVFVHDWCMTEEKIKMDRYYKVVEISRSCMDNLGHMETSTVKFKGK